MAELRILSLGAGVQSTVLYLTEAWDYAIFADTQEEPAPVYSHLEWLKAHGRAPILTRTAGKLGDDIISGRNHWGQENKLRNGDRVAAIPAYTVQHVIDRWELDEGTDELEECEDGEDTTHLAYGRTRRQCTREYKLDVIHQTVRELLGLRKRQRFPKDVAIIHGIGFSYDEKGRIGRCIAGWKRPQIRPVFPLFDRRWRREDCVTWLRKNVPHEVPRSSCVFCPFHRNEEWRWLREHDPSGWQRAIAVDSALRVPGNVVNRSMVVEMFVHRSCVPLDQANIEEVETGQLTFEGCTGGCAA